MFLSTKSNTCKWCTTDYQRLHKPWNYNNNMYQSKSTPRLSIQTTTNINEPQFDSYMYDDNSEHWDGTYATANDEPYQKAHHSPKQYRDNGTLISSDSQFLRNSLEKRADAFENVLDNAMHRTVSVPLRHAYWDHCEGFQLYQISRSCMRWKEICFPTTRRNLFLFVLPCMLPSSLDSRNL